MPLPDVVFGLGAHSRIDERAELLSLTALADREGLDLFSLSDHPYLGERLDAYAALGFVLGRTERLSGFVNVSNLPIRTNAVLARTVTSLAAISGERVVLGLGAGGNWDRITDMGVPRLTPGQAVRAFEEAIAVINALSEGGRAVTVEGEHHHLQHIDPAPVPRVPIWTGSVGPKSLAATGRGADGWIPGHAMDWSSVPYRQSRPLIDAAALSVGRDPSEIRTVFNLPGRIAERPLAQTRDRSGRWIGGSVDQWVEELVSAITEHGASGFMLFSPRGGTPDALSVGRWAAEVAPAVREAVSA